MARRTLPLILLAFALVATGCIGHKEDETKEGRTEGVWVDAGPLDYQIQGSRQLIPTQVPDDRYLAGIPESEPDPTKDETWFAVFLRIENKTDERHLTAEDFEIEDTQGKIYKPIALDPTLNAFAYEPRELGVSEIVPHPDSTQFFDSTVGAQLLFKLSYETIANRPLHFTITAPDGDSAEINLDV